MYAWIVQLEARILNPFFGHNSIQLMKINLEMDRMRYVRLTRGIVVAAVLSVIAVFSVVRSKAQVQQFEIYRQTALQEKIFLHTDRNIYLAGELCWFKIYNVDAIFHKPIDISKLAYVEVLDKNNRAVIQTKLMLAEGDGNGSLQLPVTLNSGTYKLRAYTNLMKNFNVDHYFEKTITIINSSKQDEIAVPPPIRKFDLQFFPEGGNLVNNIESKVAVRFVDENGKGINANGVILNAANDTIIKFKTSQLGLGYFLFKPEPGNTYKAVVTMPSAQIITEKLPVAYTNGYAIQLTKVGGKQLKIAVSSNGNDLAFSPVLLFAHTRNAIKFSLAAKLQNGKTEFLIETNKLGDGITHFTLFDAGNKPVCERLYFVYPAKQLQLAIKADSLEYGIRTKVNINISTNGKNNEVDKTKMSMAVYRIDSLQPIDEMTITNYLWLNSDLTGTIESPQYYFSANTPEVHDAMDNLMLTHGWRRFEWNEILQNPKPALKFLPEVSGHIVTGRVVQSGSSNVVKDIPVYFSVPGKRIQLHTAVSDEKGKIKFDVPEFYNDGEIIVQTNTAQNNMYNVEIDNPFSMEFSSRKLPSHLTNAIPAQDLIKRHKELQVQSAYHKSKYSQFSTTIDTSSFYFKSDITYSLDKYVRFTTMEEIMIEYVREIKVKKANNNSRFSVYNINDQLFMENDPLVLLDGVPVFNGNKLISYNPLNVERLEVIERKYHYENLLFNGIVNMVTYNGDLKEFELDPHVTVMDYEGLQLQRKFFSPVYELKEQYESRVPDYRNVLLWEPNIVIDDAGGANISFYSSDIPGNYVIVVQGLSENGNTVDKVLQFRVKK